jgi:hypothetical protein
MPEPLRRIGGVNDRLKEDEEQSNEPQIDCLARMPLSEEVQDTQQHSHCDEIG